MAAAERDWSADNHTGPPPPPPLFEVRVTATAPRLSLRYRFFCFSFSFSFTLLLLSLIFFSLSIFLYHLILAALRPSALRVGFIYPFPIIPTFVRALVYTRCFSLNYYVIITGWDETPVPIYGYDTPFEYRSFVPSTFRQCFIAGTNIFQLY